MAASVRETITERRLERMRLGQSVCEYVALISDPEIRLALVPLTEAEYHQALSAIAAMPGIDNLANVSLKDRRLSQEIIVRSIREESDLTLRAFSSVNEMMETLEVSDVDEVVDRYNEMMDKSSPSLDGIPEEEMDELKKALQTMDLNALSGRAWYAFKRFLGEVSKTQPLGNLLGSGSITSLTTTKE
jgi:hypothetical protein